MSEIKEQISKAEASLLKIFTSEDNQDNKKANKYIKESILIDVYKKEIDNTLETKFEEIINSIRKMRSTYLPIETVNYVSSSISQFASSLNSDEAQNSFSLYESYENTFMRMLGMPSSEEQFVSIQEDLKSIDKATGKVEPRKRTEIEDILNERSLRPPDRKVKVDLADFIKRISGVEAEDDSDDDQEIIDPDFIESEFYKLIYLLTPPITDGRISNCINEPSKRIAEPFTARTREVNGQRLKPSLIESVIRIRLGKATGIDTPSIDLSDLVDINIDEDSFGVVESIFIVRIAALIRSLARRFMELEDEIKEITAKTDRILDTQDNDGSTQGAPKKATGEGNGEEDKSELEAQRVIEDSILALMGDNSTPSDLQGQSQRTAGIRDGHLIDAMIGIVGLPRVRIESEIKKIDNKKDDDILGAGGPAVKEISEMFGTDIGIGIIDIAAFVLAMFTVTETELLGLLTTEQHDRLKRTSFSNLIPESGEKMKTNDAVDALTIKISEAYGLFVSEISEDIENTPEMKQE
jgi:hypothetical protein